MADLRDRGDELRSDQARSADNYDLHFGSFDLVMCDVCWLSARKVDEVGQGRSLEGPPISGAANSWNGRCWGGGSVPRARGAGLGSRRCSAAAARSSSG
jgi:hypothetical protein